MKQHYEIVLMKEDGGKIRLPFLCTRYQVDKVFYALAFAAYSIYTLGVLTTSGPCDDIELNRFTRSVQLDHVEE